MSKQIRGFTMDELAKWADDPRWDDELSANEYWFPLKLSRRQAHKQGLALKAATSERKSVPDDELYRRGRYWCAKSPQSHQGPFKHAIDFLVSDGAVVYAAAPGKVISVEQANDTWGPTSAYRNTLNLITIDHLNGEFTQYCHLAYHSPSKYQVMPGSFVKADQPIGEVGKTGWTDRDHLHFLVFQNYRNDSPWQFRSVIPRFCTQWWPIL